MSFFQTISAGAKALGTLAVQKAQDTYDNLRSPPQQIDCSFCPNPVMVPPAVFNWKCACTTVNLMQSEKCTTCGLIKPGNMPRPQILCTMCNRVNEVPWTNAEVQASRAAKATKKAVEAAAVKAKDTFNEMKSTPVFFNCEHCNSSLPNPNNPPPGAQGAPLAYSPQPQNPAAVVLPQVTKTAPAPASAPPNSPPEATHVLCTCCRKETAVPGSVFVNSVKVSGQKIAKGAAQAYYMVSDQRYANCPVCAAPVILPPAHQPQPVQNQAPAPRGQAAVPYTAPAPVRVELLCEKCGTQFPTVA